MLSAEEILRVLVESLAQQENLCIEFTVKRKNEPAATDSKCKNSQNLHSYSNTGGTNVQI